MALHPSGFPLVWNGFSPCIGVLERQFDASKGETPQQGYERYLQLPFFAFAAKMQFGPLDSKGNYPVCFTPEQWAEKKRRQQADQAALESLTVEVLTGTPEKPKKKTRVMSAEEIKKLKQKELEEENSRFLDEEYAKSMQDMEKDDLIQKALEKSLDFNFRTKEQVELVHNPHYALPASKPPADCLLDYKRCIEQRELYVMRFIHHAIALLRAHPNQSMCNPSYLPALRRVIDSYNSMHNMCLDPTSGGMDLFFQLPPVSQHSRSLALAKLLHIVRVPLCATFSLRQILHPSVFKSGYPDPIFPHILYNQIAQNFFRSMTLRHLTLGLHASDILTEFQDMPEFQALVKCAGDLEWWCAEREFPAFRRVFAVPPRGFMDGMEDPVYKEFLGHFVLQINISDRLRMPMAPFVHKRGQTLRYESFSSHLIREMEIWRPGFNLIQEALPLPPSVFSPELNSSGKTEVKMTKDSETFGHSMMRELLKILFMCCLGAQTEIRGDCAYSDLSDYTLTFLLHNKLSKVFNDRFLIAQPSSYPEPSPSLTLQTVWGNILALPASTASGMVWKNSRNSCEEAMKRGIH
jgi:hypothetical protein